MGPDHLALTFLEIVEDVDSVVVLARHIAVDDHRAGPLAWCRDRWVVSRRLTDAGDGEWGSSAPSRGTTA